MHKIAMVLVAVLLATVLAALLWTFLGARDCIVRCVFSATRRRLGFGILWEVGDWSDFEVAGPSAWVHSSWWVRVFELAGVK